MYKLVIQDDEGKTTVVPLIRDEITIGRKEGNTIRLTERNVSRKHARIVRANGTVAIEDLGSYNGVRVNGTRISQRTPLTVSDRVQIGDYLIELKAEGAEQAAGAPVGYDDAKTQPVERLDPGYGQRTPTTPMAGAALVGTMPTPPSGMPGQVPGQVPMQAQAPGMPHAVVPPGMSAPDAQLAALSDTDPRIPAARAAAVAPAAAVSAHARLVVLSSNFAGREFELSKPQVVIGRTDENDIVVNHRSISRNHAKVVREPDTGRYTIMDLQSSNGVRVNGEEYGKVELRRGDIIDLGHVRLRFVEAGEDFVFGRDAQAVDVPTGGGKGLWIGLAGLLVVGGIVGIVMATGGGDEEKTSSPAAATVAADAGAAGAVLPIDASAAVPQTEDKKLNEIRMAIQTAVDEEKWADVVMKCNELLEIVAGDPDCAQKKELAKREQGAQLKYDDFRRAVQKKDFAGAAQAFGDIDPDSIYKEKAREQHNKLRDEYVATQRARAANLARQGKCKDIDRLAAQVDDVWEEAAAAVKEEGARCAVVVAGDDRRDTKKDDVKKDVKKDDTKKDDSSSGTSSGKTAQQLSDEAAAAARAGQYGKALRTAEEALRQAPGDSQALSTAAIAACNLKQADKAKKYISKLSGQRQSMVRQICLRNNVTID